MEKRKLEMEFLNNLNRKYTITIEDPKLDLTSEEVQAAMDGIIAEDVFLVSLGKLETAVDARIVTTSIENLIN